MRHIKQVKILTIVGYEHKFKVVQYDRGEVIRRTLSNKDTNGRLFILAISYIEKGVSYRVYQLRQWPKTLYSEHRDDFKDLPYERKNNLYNPDSDNVLSKYFIRNAIKRIPCHKERFKSIEELSILHMEKDSIKELENA